MKASFFFLLTALIVCTTATHYDDYYDYPKYPSLAKLIAKSEGKFEILVYLLKATKLFKKVANAKKITIFAPTDYAFYRTAREVGFKGKKDDKAVLKFLAKILKPEQVIDILTYHIVPGVYPSKKVLKAKYLKAKNGVKFFVYKTTLIDKAKSLKNPELILDLIDVKYDNGIVHAIDRVLVPFKVKHGHDDDDDYYYPSPCDKIKPKIKMANKKYIYLKKLIKAVRGCYSVRSAIAYCHYKACMKGKGAEYIGYKLTVGDAVGAATTCKYVANTVSKCDPYEKPPYY